VNGKFATYVFTVMYHVIYVTIRVLRSFRHVTHPCHVLCEVHLCVTVRSISLGNFGFYCEWYVCNACDERYLSHFIVYLIIFANLCCLQSTTVKCNVVGCTTSNRDRAGVLFRFPKNAERYVRDLM